MMYVLGCVSMAILAQAHSQPRGASESGVAQLADGHPGCAESIVLFGVAAFSLRSDTSFQLRAVRLRGRACDSLEGLSH